MDAHNTSNNYVRMPNQRISSDSQNRMNFAFKAHWGLCNARRLNNPAGSFRNIGNGEFIVPRL
jgi:hypothetical protein